MTDRLGERLRRFFRVKPGEKKLAFLVFSYFFLIAAPHAIINPLRTTYFLSREGVAWLPIAYLLAVGITGLVVFFYTRIQRKRSMEALIIASLVFFAVSGLLLQWVLRAGFLEKGADPFVFLLGLGERSDHRAHHGFLDDGERDLQSQAGQTPHRIPQQRRDPRRDRRRSPGGVSCPGGSPATG